MNLAYFFVYVADVMITLNAMEGLMDTSDTNIEQGSSYTCSTERNLMFNNTLVDKKINATLSVSGLQVQAYIKDDANGQFGSGK